ncbi:MAG TPA: hypothetical protein VJC10_03735 [Patescibacteria group bacterium]|nr:hypothetical protein [Patescibacteria group bacterium]
MPDEYLPKEPLDLPREPKDLPAGRQVQPDHLMHEQQREVKTLLSWHAPGRPFRGRSKEFYATALLFVLVFEIMAFLFSWYALMAAIAAVFFLSYALTTIPPKDFHYRISSQGVKVENHFYLWQELYDFYFTKQEGETVVHIRTKAFIPGELLLTLGSIPREQLKSALLHYLPFREYVESTFVEKSGEWLSKTFPLEKVT